MTDPTSTGTPLAGAMSWAERPATCPACGAALLEVSFGGADYACGLAMVEQRGRLQLVKFDGIPNCHAAFAAAVRLTAERDELRLALADNPTQAGMDAAGAFENLKVPAYDDLDLPTPADVHEMRHGELDRLRAWAAAWKRAAKWWRTEANLKSSSADAAFIRADQFYNLAMDRTAEAEAADDRAAAAEVALADPKYIYAGGRIQRAAIDCRNEEITGYLGRLLDIADAVGLENGAGPNGERLLARVKELTVAEAQAAEWQRRAGALQVALDWAANCVEAALDYHAQGDAQKGMSNNRLHFAECLQSARVVLTSKHEPIVISGHISPDASPETLSALEQLARAAYAELAATPPVGAGEV